ncbi:hypothetical protein [Bacteroides acidifaciens]|uniref:hypothetical protein n=1 Tax=Bacteroides acidifaciens TaxID=85831 RepID=UPI001D1643B3|nr:hypothetical protein [Bacteroides acidifaciens]
MHKSSSLLILFFLFSCSFPKKDSSLDYALQRSGDNRRELEKVLEHYRDSGLKYDAARFLIENMPATVVIAGPWTRSGRFIKIMIRLIACMTSVHLRSGAKR